MQLSFASFVALVAAAVVNAQADPAINTPSGVTQCLPAQLTFSGTQPPFIVALHPGGQPDTAAIFTFPATSANSITWVANQPAGTSLTLVIRDAAGRTNPSAAFTVLPSSDSSCLNGGVGGTTAAGTTAAGVTTTPGTSAAPISSIISSVSAETSSVVAAVSSSAAAVTSRAVTSAASRSSVSSAAAAATTSPNGATSVQPLGLAGLMGLVGLAALI